MIGDKVKLGGCWVITTAEEQSNGCDGCCFRQQTEEDSECVLTEESNLECGEINAIYKMAKIEKGIKRKLTLN